MSEITFRTTYSSGKVYEESVNECDTVAQYANRHFGLDYAGVQDFGAKIEIIAIDGQTPPQDQPKEQEDGQDPELQHEQPDPHGEQKPDAEIGGTVNDPVGSTHDLGADAVASETAAASDTNSSADGTSAVSNVDEAKEVSNGPATE
jgi:hypothetical protein